MTLRDRHMPEKLNLGENRTSVMAGPMLELENWRKDGGLSPHGLRTVMGYFLPTWQRPFVWTDAQQISFIESAWRGVNLGTYTVNQVFGSPLDNLLIDGQQRMHAIERYLDDQFPVFGWKWSEVTIVDRRVWEMSTIFASYVTRSTDEDFLRGYYDMMNFSGTAHTPDQRATKATP